MLTLVTGATGLVGNNVVRRLLEAGAAVRVLSRGTANLRPLAGLEVEVVQGDIRDPAAIRRACRGAGRIIHAAADVRIGWSGLREQQAVNVEGTRGVAAAARAEGARLVFVSSVNTLAFGSRGAPANEETQFRRASVPCPYVLTKREAERVVLAEVAAGLDAVIVNPTYMLGPWDWKPSSGRMLLNIASGWALIAPPGGNDFCDVRDVAAGILAALERGVRGRRYILGGESLSYWDAWSLFAEITKVKPPRRRGRRIGMWMIGTAGDVWNYLTGREPALNSAALAFASLNQHYCYARAAVELGYRPRPAREAAESAWQWFLTHGYAT